MTDDVISLGFYMLVLRRQRGILALTAIVVAALTMFVAFFQAPVYQAQTGIAVERVHSVEDVSVEELLDPGGASIETERLIMISRPVAERVATTLELSGPDEALVGVQAEAVPDSRIVNIVVTNRDPHAAARKADTFAEAYLSFRLEQALDELVAHRAHLDLVAAGSPLSTVGVTGEDITGGGGVLSPAELPTTPVTRDRIRTGALALVLGLMSGVGVSFLRDHFDDVIHDEEDFRRANGERPILGRIPTWRSQMSDERLSMMMEPLSQTAEAYRELSANVRFLLVAHEGLDEQDADEPGEAHLGSTRGRALLVCSASAGEGKTSTAANLAVAAARVGVRTVLVDADLRRATVHKRFGLARSTGLSDVLLGDGDLGEHLVDVGIEDLLVLPAGTIPPNPAELLASPAMRGVQHALGQQAALVIYDSPPVLAVPDALELGRFMDLAILVGRTAVSSRREIARAIERLEQIGTPLAGTVVNDARGPHGVPSRRASGRGLVVGSVGRQPPATQAGTKRQVARSGRSMRLGEALPPGRAGPDTAD